MFTGTLERAILETLAYSDIFEYPLRLDELHRYLPMVVDVEQVSQALSLLTERVGKQADFYFLSEHEIIVKIRKQREAYSQKIIQRALNYGRVLGALPFIRMVALTGSLAVMNSSMGADFDYMLVAAPNRVWTARAFALLFNRVTRSLGHTICPNLIVAETALEWTRHDLYSARELCQMIPVTGRDVYQKLMNANAWVRDFLPNVPLECDGLPPHMREQARAFQNVLELPLRGKLGSRFEHWEMNRKIARFSNQAGFGEETVFNPEICQGNFDHHRGWTKKMLENKLSTLEKEVTVTVKVSAT